MYTCNVCVCVCGALSYRTELLMSSYRQGGAGVMTSSVSYICHLNIPNTLVKE